MTTPSPLLTTATEIVTALREDGCTISEIARLCKIPYAATSLKRIEDGTLIRISVATVDALTEGFERYLQDDRSFRKRRGTRPAGEASNPVPATDRQPMTRIEGSILWDRLAQKRKAAA